MTRLRARRRPGRSVAGALAVVVRREPVAAPLPDVARHVVEAKAVRCEGVDRSRPGVAVSAGVVIRELALEHVHHLDAVRFEVVTPGERATFLAAARGVFPFRFRRQPDARPLAVGDGIVPGDMDDGVAVPPVEIGVRPLRVAPVGFEHLTPPRRIDDTARFGEVVGQETCEDERPAVSLGVGRETRRVDEGTELLVRDHGRRDSERCKFNGVHRPLAVIGVGIRVDRPHSEHPAFQVDEVRRRRQRP